MFLVPLGAVLVCSSLAANPKPNIVVLLSDDLGYGDLRCFGHPRIKTPHLDQLAHEGVRLTTCYAGAPVCSPSRAALFTGRNPNRLGIRDWIAENSGIHLPRSEITVAKLLKDAGYTTCLAGKWHLNSRFNGQEPSPGDFGFDRWFATQNNTRHQGPTNFVRNGKLVGPVAGYATTLVVDEALKFIADASDKPFAVFVTFHAPHEQVAAPEKFRALYADIDDPTKRDYYGSVSLIDHEVGRLLAWLDDHRLRERTLVLFTSDNGPEGLRRYPKAIHSHGSAGPLRGGKLSMYEGGIRVPAILRWPGRTKAGTQCNEPVCFTDLLPTLCAAAGTEPPKDRSWDGINVLPLLEGKPLARDRPLYWQYDKAEGGPWTLAVRQGPWKLLADPKRERFALYNLEEDMAEKRDRVDEQPDRVRKLRAALEQLYREINP